MKILSMDNDSKFNLIRSFQDKSKYQRSLINEKIYMKHKGLENSKFNFDDVLSNLIIVFDHFNNA